MNATNTPHNRKLCLQVHADVLNLTSLEFMINFPLWKLTLWPSSCTCSVLAILVSVLYMACSCLRLLPITWEAHSQVRWFPPLCLGCAPSIWTWGWEESGNHGTWCGFEWSTCRRVKLSVTCRLCYLCEGRSLFQCISYDYIAHMDIDVWERPLNLINYSITNIVQIFMSYFAHESHITFPLQCISMFAWPVMGVECPSSMLGKTGRDRHCGHQGLTLPATT